MPFFVVDNDRELEIVFRLLKLKYFEEGSGDGLDTYINSRRLIAELPYFIKQKINYRSWVEATYERMRLIKTRGTDFDKQVLNNEIETAYVEKEIERMYDRLVLAGQDAGIVSEKLAHLKERRYALADMKF